MPTARVGSGSVLRRAVSRLTPAGRARRQEGVVALSLIAAALGAATGVVVVVIHLAVPFGQTLLLGAAVEHDRTAVIPWPRLLAALACGSLVVALLTHLDRRRGRQAVDAVEANALHGGQMGWRDASTVVLPILVSAWCGASVGIEAAVTQLGAVIASLGARKARLQRSETRLMVAAGAAAAIGAAYHAPIAGMLYAFELVLGSYSKRTLAPVALAALAAALIVRGVEGPTPAPLAGAMPLPADYLAALAVGAAGAGLGIGVMLLVSGCDWLLARGMRHEVLRRLVAASALCALAARWPGVLGSGHAATAAAVAGHLDAPGAAALLAGKSAASAVSLGGGFRGGMFSSSLMIGTLLGTALAGLAGLAALPLDPRILVIVGMAAVAASVIGSPLAMIFLVLETTGAWEATVAVAIGAVTASLLTERLFGYSFATWRFQQRGLAIEGGHDVARLRNATVAPLVRPPKRQVAPDASLAMVAKALSVAGAKGVAVVEGGRFVGLVDPALVEILDAEPGLPVVAVELVYATMPLVTPRSSLAETLTVFRDSDRATLAVVDAEDHARLVGCLRGRDVFDAASRLIDAQRADDLGIARGSL